VKSKGKTVKWRNRVREPGSGGLSFIIKHKAAIESSAESLPVEAIFQISIHVSDFRDASYDFFSMMKTVSLKKRDYDHSLCKTRKRYFFSLA
jgi:hypothetical protein